VVEVQPQDRAGERDRGDAVLGDRPLDLGDGVGDGAEGERARGGEPRCVGGAVGGEPVVERAGDGDQIVQYFKGSKLMTV
jgi:hypothetical protein